MPKGDGSFVRAASLGAGQRRFDDTGLKSLTTYRYALIAVDGAGNESALSPVAQVTTTGVPAPAAVTADDGIGRIELNWAAVHHVDLLGYNVYRATRPDQPFSRLEGDGGEAFSTGRTTFVDSSLAAGQLFYYKVTTVAAELESDPSALVSASAAADDVAPAAPTGLVAIAADDRAEVSLRWSRPRTDQDGDDLTGLRSFVVYRAQDGPGALSAVDTVDAGSSAFTDTGLEPATTYYYSVSATDGSGNVSPRALTVSATTPGISPPAALSTSGEVTRITVSWNASDEDDLLGYNVYRSTRPDEGYARLAGAEGTPFTTGQTSYVDSNLTGGQILYYRVSVVTSSGESDPSAFSGATVLVDLHAPEAPSQVTGRPVPGPSRPARAVLAGPEERRGRGPAHRRERVRRLPRRRGYRRLHGARLDGDEHLRRHRPCPSVPPTTTRSKPLTPRATWVRGRRPPRPRRAASICPPTCGWSPRRRPIPTTAPW